MEEFFGQNTDKKGFFRFGKVEALIRCDKGSDTAKVRKVMSILKRKCFVSGSGSLLSFLHILRYNKSKDKRK